MNPWYEYVTLLYLLAKVYYTCGYAGCFEKLSK